MNHENANSLAPVGNSAEVDLTWIAGKLEHKILFGRNAAEHSLDQQHKTVSFPTGSIFAGMRWASSRDGLSIVRLEILRAPKAGEASTCVPFVRPGVEILLRVSGWVDVQRVIKLIDGVRAGGIDPADAAPDYWLYVGNRIAARQTPSPYTRARHLAWQLRRRLAP